MVLRPCLLALCATIVSNVAPLKSGADTVIPLRSGMKITGNATVRPGVYRLSDAGGGIVQVSGSRFTVDFRGAQIAGPAQSRGIGIYIHDARNITLKNADVRGCLWGIVIERSGGVRLLNCMTSHNANLPPGTVIDESGREPEDNHGGGILIRDSRYCLVARCTSQNQWDGIDVVRSESNVIEDGAFSYNGNWGLHLWSSSRNTFRRNRAVWCTTGGGLLYQALTGWSTYDAQAVGIDHNSNENRIEDNDLRFGGDGIFIRANEGPITPGTVVPPRNGSHRNILRRNDCSFSPNNAIEVDLVDDTIIDGNNCSYSNYGMWLGYSRRCVVRNNICIQDSTHAVEIENGQGDLFENNVFGFDTPRPDGQLVYLRQNERDKTSSGPYTLRQNVFYGAAKGVLLHHTTAVLTGNTLLWNGAPPAQIAAGDPGSQVTLSENRILRSASAPKPALAQTPVTLRAGAAMTLVGTNLLFGATPPVVELDGIPVWITTATRDRLTFAMPDDFWDRPAPETVHLHLFNGAGWSRTTPAHIVWPAPPRITSIVPNPARLGDSVTVTGIRLGTRVLLNGKPVPIVESTVAGLVFRLPQNLLTPTRYNLIVTRGTGEALAQTWPVTFAVDVPAAQMPHLLSATFSPTTLKVGERLQVTFVVRNNLPTSAPLMTTPHPPFTYDEKQAAWEIGTPEQPGALHLRVTSDNPAGHDSGSWPWLFGFATTSLSPGETATVTGYIRMETPGTHEFRVGLVAGGSRFIDDNAFRTQVTVLP